MITFKAAYVTNAVIQEKINSEYRPYIASVVELDTKSKTDIQALREIDSLWNEHNTFANYLYRCALKQSDIYTPTNSKSKFYAVTKQKTDFLNLIPDEVLGLLQFNPKAGYKDALGEIQILQVKPEYAQYSPNRYYKHIGTSLLNFIKSKFKNLSLILVPSLNSKEFYKKNDFEYLSQFNKMLYKAK